MAWGSTESLDLVKLPNLFRLCGLLVEVFMKPLRSLLLLFLLLPAVLALLKGPPPKGVWLLLIPIPLTAGLIPTP